MYECLNYLDNFKENRKWNKLQEGIKIENYQLLKSEQKDYGSILTVKLPYGGTTTKLEENIEAIEKAYKCRCLIRNISFSDLVEIELITKEIKSLKQPLMLLSPYQLSFGYDCKGQPIITDMKKTTYRHRRANENRRSKNESREKNNDENTITASFSRLGY